MSDQQERNGSLYPFANFGARTERGGCATSGSELCISGPPVACVGDVVTYGDDVDHGDVINDSRHRDVRTSTFFVPVNEHGVELRRQ